MKAWGERLKAERERLGYSQAKFGEACGVGRTAQFNYEREEREPGLTYLDAAETLGVDTLYVFTGARKGEDWAYARAYKRVLLTIEMLLGLDENGLEPLAQMVIENDAKIDVAREGVDIEPFFNAVRAWLRTGSKPDQLLDLGLLAAIIEQVDTAKAQHPTLTSAKQGQVISTLYRAFKASGKLDNALILSTVALAAE